MCAYCTMSTDELTKNQLNYLRFKERYANYYRQNRDAIISRQKEYHKKNVRARNQYQREYEHRTTERKKITIAKRFRKQYDEYLKRREKFFNSAEHQW
jgi:hypothetical protein